VVSWSTNKPSPHLNGFDNWLIALFVDFQAGCGAKLLEQFRQSVTWLIVKEC
jgi:hypothetical protein